MIESLPGFEARGGNWIEVLVSLIVVIPNMVPLVGEYTQVYRTVVELFVILVMYYVLRL